MEIINKRIVNDVSVYVKILWEDSDTNLFQIQVLNAENSWSGTFTQESTSTYSSSIDETPEEFKKNVKEALTSATPSGYKFLLTNNDTVSTFTWLKSYKVNKDQKFVPHGSVPINADNPPVTYTDFIDQLINNNNHLQGTVGKYSDKIKILNDELDKVRDEMKKFISMKTSLETSLYGKFVELLNTKKRRIQELEKHLGDIDNEEMQ